MPLFDVGRLERLQRDRADERRDLVREQLAVALGCLGRDLAERNPLLDPFRDMRADRERRSRDMLAFADGCDQLGELGLRFAFRALEAAVFGRPFAGCILSRVELELEAAGAALSQMALHSCSPVVCIWRSRIPASISIMRLTLPYRAMAASIAAPVGSPAWTRATISSVARIRSPLFASS